MNSKLISVAKLFYDKLKKQAQAHDHKDDGVPGARYHWEDDVLDTLRPQKGGFLDPDSDVWSKNYLGQDLEERRRKMNDPFVPGAPEGSREQLGDQPDLGDDWKRDWQQNMPGLAWPSDSSKGPTQSTPQSTPVGIAYTGSPKAKPGVGGLGSPEFREMKDAMLRLIKHIGLPYAAYAPKIIEDNAGDFSPTTVKKIRDVGFKPGPVWDRSTDIVLQGIIEYFTKFHSIAVKALPSLPQLSHIMTCVITIQSVMSTKNKSSSDTILENVNSLSEVYDFVVRTYDLNVKPVQSAQASRENKLISVASLFEKLLRKQ